MLGNGYALFLWKVKYAGTGRGAIPPIEVAEAG